MWHLSSLMLAVPPPHPPLPKVYHLFILSKDVTHRTLPNLYPLRLAKSILVQKLPSRFSCNSALKPDSDTFIDHTKTTLKVKAHKEGR